MPKSNTKSNSPYVIVRYKFPYARFHGKSYPLIPVTLSRGRRRVNTFALLDSGASISVFRPEIAKALRVSNKGRSQMRLGTGGGGVDIRISKIHMQIKDTRFMANIGFADGLAPRFNILGREGFFRHFSICFNEIMKTVILVPLRKLHP